MSDKCATLYVIRYNLWECVQYVMGASTYHKSTDAPLWRVPFEAAVDVAACVDQEHDAAPNSVEVAQQQLKRKQRQNTVIFKTRSERCCSEENNRVLYPQNSSRFT